MLYARIIGAVIGILLAAGTICACGLFDQDDNGNDDRISKDTVLTEETLVEEIIVEEIQVQEIQIK